MVSMYRGYRIGLTVAIVVRVTAIIDTHIHTQVCMRSGVQTSESPAVDTSKKAGSAADWPEAASGCCCSLG